jgi:DNA-binding CsgD family transcriptional regulator/tetratricopeptide (TPR) repeat protein
MSAGVSSPDLVGRTDQLATMSDGLAGAAAGNPSLLTVLGVAGVGKTRLVTEFAERARAQGARVLVGNCLELTTGDLPLGPVATILRDFARSADPDRVAAVLGSARGELARLVPALASGVDDADVPSGSVPAGDPDLDRREGQSRLFDQLLDVLGRIGVERPTVVVLEDIQAADSATRDLISFLLHNFRDERVFLILTFRTEHVARGHPLLGWIGELGRHPRATSITLGPLSAAETSLQVEAILGGTSDEGLVSRILERSGGNPLFTEELVAAAGSGSETLPDLLSEMLLAKVRALPESSVEILRVAAVARRPFDEGFLASVLGGFPGEYLVPVRQAVDGQVLVADPAGYRFRHGLYAEAVAEDLTSGERRVLHERIAAALEAQPVSAVDARWMAGEAARHWRAADRPTEAYRASIEAAVAAGALRAGTSALEHWEAAMELRERVDAGTRSEILQGHALDEIEVIVRAAWSADLDERHDRAIELAERAIAMVDVASDPTRAGALQSELAQILWYAGRFAEAERAFESAAALVGPDAPVGDRARVLSWTAAMHFWRGRFDLAIELGREAVDAARSSGQRAIEVDALAILGDALNLTGSTSEAIQRLTEARQTAAEAGSVEGLLFATDSLAECLVDADRLEEAIAVATRGAEDARRFGLDRRFGAMFRGQAGMALFELGRWGEAEAMMSQGLDIGHGRLWGLCVRARLLAAMGRTDEASEALAAILATFPEDLPDLARLEIGGSRIDILLVDGDLAGAVEGAMLTLAFDYPSVGLRLGIAASGLRAAADLAEVGRARRDGPAVEQAIAAGETLGAEVARQREIIATWSDPTPSKVAAISLADAEQARLARASDPDLWASIEFAYDRVPMPLSVAYARYRRAEALLMKEREKALPTELLRAAHATCAALGAAPMTASIEGLARRARVELSPIQPAEPDVSPVRAVPDRVRNDLGLSARELEVLALVADGMTNGEIAKALFITRKTASAHVTHILDKLGAANRVEAAVIAERAGLTVASDAAAYAKRR